VAEDSQSGLRTLLLGDRRTIAGTVYGTIIVLSVLAAGAKHYKHFLWRLDAIAAVSVVVLWLAHVYAHGLGESLQRERRLTIAELRDIARREYSIVLAAVPPVFLVTLGAVGVLSARTALWLAFGIGVITLTAQGARYAKLEHLSRTGTIFTVGLNLLIGLSLIAIETLIAH
jgi:hypothetical protein